MYSLSVIPGNHSMPAAFVKKSNSSSNFPHGNWQILGEYEQAVEADMDAKIQASLTQILCSLPLPAGFLDRILKSAHDSATRAPQSKTALKTEYIHLKVLVLQYSSSYENTWGFFRIEKVGTPIANTTQDDHSIEFYLYLEE